MLPFVKQLKRIPSPLIYKLRYQFRKTRFSSVYNRVLEPAQSNALIGELIAKGDPLMITRFGSNEVSCAYQYLRKKPYTPSNIHNISIVAGFFPVNKELLDSFCQLYLDSTQLIDVLGIWHQLGEGNVIQQFCHYANFVPLFSLEPYYHQDPWSRKLKNKKVLVIHPFAESIAENYIERRDLLFQNKDILPEFKLSTIKAVQTLAGNQSEFESWFKAYEWMCQQIDEQDFDIALIGCGAYGLPLAAYVKSLGKQAIHLGGATQILFGIKGKRWDDNPFFQNLYNKYWTRPKTNEIPMNHMLVEDGSYW